MDKHRTMSRITKLVTAVVLSVATMLFATPAVAQVRETSISGQAASAKDDAMPALTFEEVESALAAIEGDSGIENSVKDLLRTKYKQAIEALKESAINAAKAAEYRESITQAPETAAALHAQLDELPSVESAGDVTVLANPNDLKQELHAKRASVAALNDQLSSVTNDSSLAEQRPTEISARIPESERELADVRKQLASSDLVENVASPSRVADRLLLQARELELLNELEMLVQEQLSLSVRRTRQQAQKKLLARQIENASAFVTASEALMNRTITEMAQDIGDRAEKMGLNVPKDDQEAVAMAAEVQKLATQLEKIVQDKQKMSAAKADVTSRLQRLTQRYDSIRKQLELDQPGSEMAQVLIDLRALLSMRVREVAKMRRWPTLGQTRLAAVQVDFKIDGQRDVQEEYADQSSRAVQDLVVARNKVLDKLQTQYLELVPLQSSLDTETQKYFEKAKEVRIDIRQQLFWIRVSPTLSLSTVTEIPNGLRWVFGREHWSECGGALVDALRKTPISSTLVVVLAISLLLMRPQIGAALKRTGEGVGRVSTDRFSLTARAVFWTALLALPVPLLVGLVASALSKADSTSAWLGEINRYMSGAIVVISAAAVIAASCYPGGLGGGHFAWRKESLSWLRRGSHWFAFVYIPLTLLACCTLSSSPERFFHSVGRVTFLFLNAWLLIVLARLFYSSDGIHATYDPENPNRPVARSLHLWPILMIACPLGLIVLAARGYTMTAFNLSFALVFTLIIAVSGVIFYALGLRWFKIEYRKLAFAEAHERRRARQEAATAEGQREDLGEVVSIDEDEQELDLDSVGEQTRYVLKLFFGLGIATAVLSLWSATLPLISYLDTIRIPLTVEFTLLDLANVVLVVAVTWLVTKNLPGMLELAVLRASSMQSGTRYAITTICQYVVMATGLVLLVNVLNLDWAKFGWIAGGLSVGIGFGLQEVVANFICGLILLIERPIRVGDVVTVEGTIGTVTKIQMRATTITNWDRQDFVVPNKTLITGTILNWTLSASMNRIVIPVGVAYGSDTEKARQILLDVAADHPRVLDDPAPMATFEQFADSSLSLLLRAYLPDLENRIGTITELHTEINRRFADAGIEIAFPQRDLHVRSVDPSVRIENNSSEAEWVDLPGEKQR